MKHTPTKTYNVNQPANETLADMWTTYGPTLDAATCRLVATGAVTTKDKDNADMQVTAHTIATIYNIEFDDAVEAIRHHIRPHQRTAQPTEHPL